MEELESQIAKIQLGNFRRASSYVYVLAEKAMASDAELYLIAELPLLNPAAEESCEKICLAIAGALKRAYKKPFTEGSFESAIAQINEELGKLASMGQVHWINKLNCLIAVKYGPDFTIATCGKVMAYLFRAGEFTDIACSPTQSHPLKTFENYATGRIRLNDLLILSTAQLFNYISMDRLRSILTGSAFLNATKTIVELLKDNGGPDAAFGTIFNLQVQPGQTTEEEVDLENFVAESQSASAPLWAKAWEYIKGMIAHGKSKRIPKVDLPSFSSANSAAKIKSGAIAALGASKSIWSALGRGVAYSKNTLRPENFKTFSREKKFFIISLGVLVLAVIISLTVAVRLKNTRAGDSAQNTQIKQAQTFLNNAQTSFLYNDQNSAQDYLSQAQGKMPKANEVRNGNKALYQTVSAQLTELEQKIQKQTQAEVTNLGALAAGSGLIKLPNIVAVQSNKSIISFSKTTGRIEDGVVKANDTIVDNVYFSGNTTAIYNGSSLRLWDFSTGSLTAPFSTNVPSQNDFGGLAAYQTNSRVYIINKATSQIINFTVFGNNLTKPAVSLTDPSLNKASSLAIDSAIYIVSEDQVLKFQSGKPADFKTPVLSKPLSDTAKIYTEKGWEKLYILDAGNNRIIITDKKGTLISTLQSSQFTKLVDFQVDEKNKTAYVLNDGTLLKVTLP